MLMVAVDTSISYGLVQELQKACYKIARGADTLTEFVKVWANVAPGDEVQT
jgi:hypothetical protein